jgi:non-ribosomal peptide synthetase component F
VVSGRPPEIDQVEQIVGVFINTVPLRIQHGPTESFSSVVQTVQEAMLQGSKFSYRSMSDILVDAGWKENLIDHILVFEQTPQLDQESGAHDTTLSIQEAGSFEQTNYALTLNVVISKEIHIRFDYNRTVYLLQDLRIYSGNLYRILNYP